MKLPLTTALSIAGVLTAGVAAALVNTQTLQSRADSTVGEATASLVVDSQASTGSTPTPTQTVVEYVYETDNSPATSSDATKSTVTSPSTTDSTKSVATTGTKVTTTAVTPEPVITDQPKSKHQDDEDDDDHEEEGDDLD